MIIQSSIILPTYKEVCSRQMLSAEHYNGFEEQGIHNKWTLSFTTNSTPCTKQDTRQWWQLCMPGPSNVGPNTTIYQNYSDATASIYKTPFCAKLSQKNFPGLIWSYVKLNILRKITHLAQKNSRKFDLCRKWKLPSRDQYNTDGHAILDSHAIFWIRRGRGEVCSTPRSSPLPFYIPCLTNKVPLSYTFYWRMVPLSHT